MVYVQDHLGTHPQESSSDCRELVMLNPMTLLADPTLGLGWVVKAALRWMSWQIAWTVTQGPQFRQCRTTDALIESAVNTSSHSQPGPSTELLSSSFQAAFLGEGNRSGLMDLCRVRNPCYEDPW